MPLCISALFSPLASKGWCHCDHRLTPGRQRNTFLYQPLHSSLQWEWMEARWRSQHQGQIDAPNSTSNLFQDFTRVGGRTQGQIRLNAQKMKSLSLPTSAIVRLWSNRRKPYPSCSLSTGLQVHFMSSPALLYLTITLIHSPPGRTTSATHFV